MLASVNNNEEFFALLPETGIACAKGVARHM